MNSKELLHALQSGKISPENAEKELIKIMGALPNSQSKNPMTHSVIDLCEIEPGIVQLTMQDRVNKNTFSKEFILGLIKAFEVIKANSSYKVVILTGYDSYFSSGGTKEGLLAIYEGKIKFTDTNIYSLALDCKIPVIAAMQGHGIGAGWSMGMFCDFIVMSRESIYTSNYMKYGFTPGAGATMIFPEKLGISLAQEILFTSKEFHGSDLETKGIPFPVLPRKEVLPYAIQMAKKLSQSPRKSLIALKDLMAESIREKVSRTYEKELNMHEKTFVNQPEVKERIHSLFGQASGNENDKKLIHSAVSMKEELFTKTIDEKKSSQEAIAIIGMSGQFPKSKTLAEFWDNLAHGRDCISEIPATRWSIDQYYDPDLKASGKTNSKWIGVLDDVDQFDPLFFNISPTEAELMDPQQRLFLENCWHSIEDAGLSPSSLSGSRCGVFVGCATGDYGQLMEQDGLSAQGFMGGATSILSARISYLLNLKGPCLAIDTACSSSLVAIAEACNSLILKDSDIALAGGVCVMTGPSMHIMTSKSGMLSKDGRCFTFDNRANGFVPGEGVGVILLKRLSDALRDQDQIYGVIRGWGINQDGKTNGITAPSVNSQVLLEKDVYQRFNINPETISLVEAHGTGTKLGDPIEVEALTESFQTFTNKKNYCALGSVKSNIGHLLTAAGVSGVIKVLLALKHRMLPPTINYESLNEHISLDNSPFYINTKLQPWELASETPRRASISSFGFSGTNAHIVIEEYQPKIDTVRPPIIIDKNNPIVFVLSAKSEEQLIAYAESMKSFVESQEDLNLADMAYTLQLGREAMDYRMAFLADSRVALLKALEGFCENGSSVGILTAQVKKSKDGVVIFAADEDMQKAIDAWISKRKYTKLLNLWVKGLNIDWNKLYGGTKPRRISLPTYPFAKERYWVPKLNTKSTSGSSTTSGVTMTASIHPLLHNNTSDLCEQRFSSTFTGQEFFLADHVVMGKMVLPGAAYLEMVRAAVDRAAGGLKEEHTGIRLKNVVWTRPIAVEDQPFNVNISLFPEDNGEIGYEIYSDSGADNVEPIVHSQGRAVFSPVTEIPALDLPAIQAQCSQNFLSSVQCYDAFRSMGLEYGPGHQGIEMVYVGTGQVLAKISLPSSVSHTHGQFILHPSLMDSALQASIGLMLNPSDSSGKAILKPILPFALQELESLGSCPPSMWVMIRYSDDSVAGDKVQKLDIDLCDDQGKVCVRMKGFSTRVLEGEVSSDRATATPETLILQPFWQEQAIALEVPVPIYAQHLLMLCEPDKLTQKSIKSLVKGAHCITLQSQKQAIEERFQDYTLQAFKEIQNIIKAKPKDDILIQIVVPLQEEQQLFSGLSGLLKTAHLENPKLIGQLIEVDNWEISKRIIEILKENSTNPIDNLVRYHDGKRYVTKWREVEVSQKEINLPWKDRGIYLITGGTGNLGFIFAREITERIKDATLILTGRSPLNEEKQTKLKELEALGARIEYKQVDVTQKKAVSDLIHIVNEEFGTLNGIIHSAGVIRDNFIINKTPEEMREVLTPKVTGLINLDQATKDLPLDFFIFFSSGAGAIGNIGQADYVVANAFMDAYARYRNTLVASKQRLGQTLSINWPLWKDGGMQVNATTEEMLRESMGMVAMQTTTGIRAFYQSFASGKEQVLVIEGDLKRLKATFLDQQNNRKAINKLSTIKENKAVPTIAQDLLQEKATNFFKQLLSSVIKLPAHRIEADAPMEKYGIDSIMAMQLTNQLEKIFGSLSKTLFFEYQNLKDLTGYFLASYREQLTGLLGIEKSVESTTPQAKDFVAVANSQKTVLSSSKRNRFASNRIESQEGKVKEALDIAIIGVAGRYPKARNIHEFWKNLRDGKDCITEIPKERWDHSLYFDEDKNKSGKTYSKWGGFMEGVDQFDPLFFNITPHEAETMDPQERIFLECVYETLEDAGYTREALGLHQGFGLEANVGVYVGVMYEEYQLYGAQEQIQGRSVALAGSPSSIANRVSYFCNFHGPSMAVDTMCSSSLTAIHLACQSLQRGGCELAIAGGVNVSIHPNKYLMLGQGKFVSSKGRCESFGQGGDGYVPGEGVGALLLKPLSKAISDGDHVYGIIKSTAMNHGGKTNGYTVPNPNAQASVIERAFKEARIDPRTISYIEAHGTGTSLGDPIEIVGLTKTFQGHTKDKQFCAIGSAKSNIGHCESAAGIAGVTKVLLQLKHRQLVPSLHSDVLNPNIDFSNTPFVVTQELLEWKRPVVEINGKVKEYPRIAGISAFGAGGSNAHVVIEEYIPNELEGPPMTFTAGNQVIIVLSAKNEVQLHEQARRLLAAIQEQRFSDADLVDIAYTLQVGREAMEERLAVIACSIKELEKKLKGFVEGRDGIEDLYRGQVKRNKETLSVFAADEDMAKTIEAWINKGKYAKLIDLWVKGLFFDWNNLYRDTRPRRISLPTYPFARERYWVPKVNNHYTSTTATTSVIAADIHPLLHKNTSRFSEQRFTSIFTGQEYFLTGHAVKGQRILPGMAYLEMARAAVDSALDTTAKEAIKEGRNSIQIKNVVWARHITIEDQPVQVHIGLYPEENDEIAYEIYSESEKNDTEPLVYSQGVVILSKATEAPILDIKSLQAQCTQNILSPSQCYEAFRTMGIDPEQQGIERVYVGASKVLAKLSLPSSISENQDQFVLHPNLLNSALQASIGLMISSDGILPSGSILPLNPSLPFTLEELEIHGSCTPEMWALIQYSAVSKVGEQKWKLNIDLGDEQGNVLVRMKGVSYRLPKEDTLDSSTTMGTIMLKPSWQEQSIVTGAPVPDYNQHLVVFCEPSEVPLDKIQTQMNRVRCLVLQSSQKEIDKRYQNYAAQVFAEIQGILKGNPNGKVLVQIVVSTQDEGQMFSGFSGLLKTAHLENPKFIGQLIEVGPGEDSVGILEKLQDNSRHPLDQQIRYQDGQRWVSHWDEVEVSQDKVNIPWKDHGVYLITGGVGGLGFIFAKEIVHKVKNATLILTGRSPLEENRQAKLKELAISGARVVYKQVDVIQKRAVISLIKSIQKEFGCLHGIIHSAGVIRDSFIIKKTEGELQEVLSPKVSGLVNLDQVSKDLTLDFFILFSSLAGSFGNPGQADYSTANAFMDAYARYRNSLVASGQRYGQTLSVNWPLWKEGGMKVDEEIMKAMMQDIGISLLETSIGIKALYQGITSHQDQVIIMEGNVAQMKQKLFSIPTPTISQPMRVAAISAPSEIDSGFQMNKVEVFLLQTVANMLKVEAEDIDDSTDLHEYGYDRIMLTELADRLNEEYKLGLTYEIFFTHSNLRSLGEYLLGEIPDKAYIAQIDLELLREKTLYQLKALFAEITKLDINRIDNDEVLENYGVNSIMITQLNQKLAGTFGELSKTIFFEYQTLGALAGYLIIDYPNECIKWTGLTDEERLIPQVSETSPEVLPLEDNFHSLTPLKTGKKLTRSFAVMSPDNGTPEPIAIIGISGRYPQARNLKEYWENLRTGKDCIMEIPNDRWEQEGFYHPDPQVAVAQGKSYSKWGGFLERFADFDSLFFNISPREAINIDPQERLFIESCWEVFEDAGYTKEQLAERHNGQVGVFAGITKTGFNLYGPDLWRQGEHVYPYTSFSSVANRISYLLNLQGPSMPIDTMCSASLTAIHEACEHLRNRDCEMAIAGGVNLYLHPSSYIGLCAQQMLSKNNQCTAFGQGGDGFVPGEGVGSVLLKPLSRAEQDGDHIYAVIIGSHTNHNGKTNGYMVSNPNAQSELILRNLKKSGVDPRTISYVEAAAFGSNLGDAIEVNALVKAFSQQTKDKYFCAIGSVKPNIGHLEAASGISQLTKVILQLQHQQLVPSIYAEPPNPNLSFNNTPFYLQRELQEWKRPLVEVDGKVQEIPRRATVSSFGAGGSNAHLIVEEYIPAQKRADHTHSISQPQIMIFSAKNQERLLAIIEQMLDFIEGEDDFSLPNFAYTLQVGREAMTSRIAMVVSCKEELIKGLKEYLNTVHTNKNTTFSFPIFSGELKMNNLKVRELLSREIEENLLESFSKKDNLEKLAQLWVQGGKIPWELLHNGKGVQRISLPTYPFAKQRFWINSKIENTKEMNFSVGNIEACSGSQQKQTLKNNKSKLVQELQEVLSNFQDKKSTMELTIKKINKILPDIPDNKEIEDEATQEAINNILRNFEHSSSDVEKAVDDIFEQLQKKNNFKLNILVKETLCNLLSLKMEDVGMDIPLLEYGMDSVIFMDLYQNLRQYFNFLDITETKHSTTLQDIILQIEKQVDTETLSSILLKKKREEQHYSKSVLSIGSTENFMNFVLRENEIEEQRQQILGKLTKISQAELSRRNLIKEDTEVPSFETFDIMLDDRNCIWTFFKVKVFGEQEVTDITNLDTFLLHNVDLEKVPILYFTHYGPHFLLGGDRLFFAESNRNEGEKDKFQQWFEKLKLMFNSNPPENYPLRVAVCAGTAQGGGFEYLISCDFQFVLPQVKLGVPEIKSNLYAGMGGLNYLATQAGLARTKLLNLTGGLIYGYEAYQTGLISHLSINPFDDAYYFYEAIPNIKIAKHLNHRLNQQYKDLRSKDLYDWVQFTQENVKEGYKHIVDDYKMFNS